MTKLELIATLRKFDKQGRYVFRVGEFAKLFPNDNPKARAEGLNRHVKAGLIKRACRGVYVNEHANSFDGYVIEHIAIALRSGEYNYVSLESALSEYGEISQIPMDRLTVMSTGRSGTYKTCYGIVEFTHTKRSASDVLKNSRVVSKRPLRIATREAALRDLRRVGRNLHLVRRENATEL